MKVQLKKNKQAEAIPDSHVQFRDCVLTVSIWLKLPY